MPKFKEISLETVPPRLFEPAENDNVTVWIEEGNLLSDGTTVTYQRRKSASTQATRKSQLNFTTPYFSVCPNTCAVISRGSNLFKVENVVSATATVEERTKAYESLVLLLQDEGIKDAFISNGSFYS